MLWFSITDSFMKAFVILFNYVFSDGNYNVNFELNPRIVVMVTYCFVDALWIESRFVFTVYNMIVSCDFFSVTTDIVIYVCSARLETLGWEMKAIYFPSKTHGPRCFYTNAELKVKSTTRFQKMCHSKKKETARFNPSSKLRTS